MTQARQGQSPAPPQIGASGVLRIALRLTALVALLLACLPLYYLWHPFTLHNPWPRRFLAGVVRIMGVRITVTGETVGRGEFFLSNHVSWLDIPALASRTGSAFVAHDGLTSHGVLHWLGSLNDTVFIARHDRASVARQVDQVREAIRETGSLAIFPEGTTADGIDLLPFKSSLLSALTPVPEGITVQPVWLDYGSEAADVAWVGDTPGIDNFLMIAARSRPLCLTIHFLPPLAGEDLASRKTIAAAAFTAIEQARLSAQTD